MLLKRTLFDAQHELFRDAFRRFVEVEIVPHYDRWEMQGHVDPALFRKAGAAGYLCPTLAPEWGGAGADLLYSIVISEELLRANASAVLFGLHSDIVARYVERYGTVDQRRAYLPRMASGEMIGAIAMTEPSGGTDLRAMCTTARRDGDHFHIKGEKTYISNATIAGLVVLAARTGDDDGGSGISLFLVEESVSGFQRGPPLRKIGMHAQDTASLFFDMRLPATALLGDLNRGFDILKAELAWERLLVGIGSTILAERAIEQTAAYTKERTVFGQRVFDFQNTRFQLAECLTETQMARVFVDRCIELEIAGELDPTVAAMVKCSTSDLAQRVLDRCLQLHGGYGYMAESGIGRAFVDHRFQPIAAGSNEIMKELIARKI